MTVLLDENLPLALLRGLIADGEAAEHVITLGLRGAADQVIRERLLDADVLFLTQDDDFLFTPPSPGNAAQTACGSRSNASLS